MKVVIIGPAHPLRGGLATFNHRLAEEFIKEGHECSIYSFSLQYPSFLFPGKTQYSDEPAPEGIHIVTCINSIHPLNWLRIGRRLKKEKPDLIVVRFWIPLMAPALGSILRIVRKNKHSKIVAIADNVIPHEKRIGDNLLIPYFLKSCDAFVTMSEKVIRDLRIFEQKKPAIQVLHPLYDNFGQPVSKPLARQHLSLPEKEKLLLFFGFIRHYKGLDLLLEAMKKIQDFTPPFDHIKLLIAGEFYEDETKYLDLIRQLGITSSLHIKTEFIPNAEVKYYLCAADAVVQPYRNATQSGVTPLAYHFEKPMIVTNVGSLPHFVPDGLAGIVVEPQADSIAQGVQRFYSLGEEHFIPHLRTEKKKYAWSELTKALLTLSHLNS